MSGSENELEFQSSGGEEYLSDAEFESGGTSSKLPKKPERGQALPPFIAPWRGSLALEIPLELEDDPELSDQERRMRQAARDDIVRSHETLSKRMEVFEKPC